MKKVIALSSIALSSFYVYADVTIGVDMGDFFNALELPAPITSYAVLVADTGSNGFLGSYTSAADADFSIFSGTSLTIGSSISGAGDDQIIGVFRMQDFGGASGIQGSLSGINVVSGSLAANQQLAVYWFPTVTTTSIAGTLSEYGFYRSDTVDASSDIAFVMPGDGANVNLYAFNFDGGSVPVGGFVAVAVPEPSTYAAIFGALALGFVAHRRRKA